MTRADPRRRLAAGLARPPVRARAPAFDLAAPSRRRRGGRAVALALGLTGLLTLPLAAQTAADDAAAVEAFLDEARAECEALDGHFDAAGAVTRVDQTRDGRDEAILDAARLVCSARPAMWRDPRGRPLVAREGAVSTRLFVVDWQAPEVGLNKVLLLQRKGDVCGGTDVEPCYEAVVRNSNRFLTVGPIPQ